MYEFLIYAALGMILLYDMKTERIRNTKAERIIYAALVVFFVIRFSLGPDSGIYAQLFNRTVHPFQEAFTSHMSRNLLYTLLSFSAKKLFGEYRWLVFLQNVLILGGCSYVIFKYSKHKLLSLLLFIGGGMLEVFYGSGVRQGLAMTIFLVSFYQFLPKKQYLFYMLGCLAAFGFQEIALIALFVPFVYHFLGLFHKKPVKFIIVTTVISLLFFLVIRYFARDFAYYITGKYGVAPVWTHVIAYLRFQQFSILGFGMECVFGVGILLMYWLADREKLDDFTVFSLLVFLFSVFIYIAFACYDIMSRVSDFIQIIMLILIPALLDAIPKNKKLPVLSGIILLNGFLLYADVSATVRRISGEFQREFTIQTYPYITVFDTERVNEYQVLLDRE